ncbi:uncharacterized protein L201_005824 [Kwoniella dendrophila CBS 6074]|uniref:Uncharacterized protein n=1 Tax=Kwoniella dendrophila CBS 6074 TaxID=1295534 RepID=A0AAX4JZV9_9TREE
MQDHQHQPHRLRSNIHHHQHHHHSVCGFPVFDKAGPSSSSSSSSGQNKLLKDLDLEWIPIPSIRPRYEDDVTNKIKLTNLLSPKPSLEKIKLKAYNITSPTNKPIPKDAKSEFTYAYVDRVNQYHTNNNDDSRLISSPLRIGRTSSKIWLKAKERFNKREGSFNRRKTPASSHSCGTDIQGDGEISHHHGGANDNSEGRQRGVGKGEITSEEEEEEEWEIITPPLTSPCSQFSSTFSFNQGHSDSEQSSSSSGPQHQQIDDEEEMFVGARGTGTISRVSQRAQQGSALDLLEDIDVIRSNGIGVTQADHPPISHEMTNDRNHSVSASGSGSCSDRRSPIEIILNQYQFPSPPSHSHLHLYSRSSLSQHNRRNHSNQAIREPNNHVKQKKSWLEGGPLTSPNEREDIPMKLPDDHPFNSNSNPNSSSTHSRSSSVPSQNQNSASQDRTSPCTQGGDSREEEEEEEDEQSELRDNHQSNRNPLDHYTHLKHLFLSLIILKNVLYKRNLDSIKLLSSSKDILPLSIVLGIESRLDRFWLKWSKILNLSGNQVTKELSLLLPHLRYIPNRNLTSLRISSNSNSISRERESLEKLIPKPVTSDELERLIWSLEVKFKIPSGTFTRMFGSKVSVRKMTLKEEIIADENGLRDWMIGEKLMKERDRWREDGMRKGK